MAHMHIISQIMGHTVLQLHEMQLTSSQTDIYILSCLAITPYPYHGSLAFIN